MEMPLYPRLGRRVKFRDAESLEILSGFTKILKHSARLFLHVMEGSKRISPSLVLALALAAFLPEVSEKFLWVKSGLRGFILGSIMRIRVRASCVHWCGLGHPSSLSLSQSLNGHAGVVRCGWFMFWIRILFDIRIRSATFVIACRRRRHLAGLVAIEQGIASGWYQAGSWAQSLGEICIAARFTLYFLAVCSIRFTLSLRRLSLAPRDGASHVCRKVFKRARCEVPGGAALLMIWSVTAAQVGREEVKFKYDFSHTISITSFLVWIFSRFRLPSWGGRLR